MTQVKPQESTFAPPQSPCDSALGCIDESLERLGATQKALAAALGCTQNNVSNYENGQTLPPERARRLIEYAEEHGVSIGFDDIYHGTSEQVPA